MVADSNQKVPQLLISLRVLKLVSEKHGSRHPFIQQAKIDSQEVRQTTVDLACWYRVKLFR